MLTLAVDHDQQTTTTTPALLGGGFRGGDQAE